jgi:hypothetical protein
MSFDRLLQVEEKLLILLDGLADVDGHDYGSNELNIFILTEKPEEIFKLIEPSIASMGAAPGMRAAYCNVCGEHYTILQPSDLIEFAVA